MHANHHPEQTRRLPTRLKLMLAVPVAILVCQLLLLAFAGSSDAIATPW